MQESSRTRTAGRAAMRDLFEQVRQRYFRLPPAVRRVLFVVVLVAALGVTAALGGRLDTTFVLTVIVLCFVALTLHFPRAAATSLVIAGWLALHPLFTLAFPPPSMVPTLLVLLTVPVVAAAHLIRWVTPWVSALLALVAAGALAAALSFIPGTLAVWVAYGAAAAVLGYRYLLARKARSEMSAEEQVRVQGPRGQAGATVRQAPALPQISVEDALAELDEHDRPGPGQGAGPLDRRLHRGVPAARRGRLHRGPADQALRLPRPARHRQDQRGPHVAKIFYAFGLLETPYVVEAQRADLVGEFLGATAIKTNELVDRALGGVLFIDEAYGLINSGDGQPDRFGAEAVQTLLKRAEDDRDRLIIILAGYEQEMASFLSTNPGLASRFATRVRFPELLADELPEITELLQRPRATRWRRDARAALLGLFEDVARRGSSTSWATPGSPAASSRRRRRPVTSGWWARAARRPPRTW